MKKEFQIIGLDIGRGYVKGYTEYGGNKNECLFKSVVGLGRYMNFDDYTSPIYIETDEEDYFCGILAEIESDNAIQNLKDDKTSAVAKKLLYAALNKLAVCESVKLMIGVPNKLFRKSVLLEIQKEYKNTTVKIKDKITGAYKSINILDVSIYREADAALLWTIKDTDIKKNDLCMVTIGFRTTEICVYDNHMKFKDKLSKTVELGNKTVLEYVQKRLKEENIIKELNEIDSSNRYDKYKDIAYKNLAEKISQDIEGLLINISEYDIFIGGGTALNMKFDDTYDIIDDAQMATSKGLYKVGCSTFK